MYCMHCGQQIPDGSKFCGYCGQSQNGKKAPSRPIVQNPYGGQSPYGNSSQQNSSLAGKTPSFLNYRTCQTVISVLLLLQMIVYFIPVAHPKDEMVEKLVRYVKDGWSVMSIAEDLDKIVLIITLIIMAAVCLFSFCLTFADNKKASLPFTIIGSLTMAWNLLCIAIYLEGISDYIERIERYGVRMTKYPILYFGIFFTIAGIILTILTQIFFRKEPAVPSQGQNFA